MFAKRSAGNGYRLTLQDLHDFAYLMDRALPPSPEQGSRRYAHYSIRGKEWDLAPDNPQDLTEDNLPLTVQSVHYRVSAEPRSIRLDVSSQLSWGDGVEFEVMGDDRNWVTGTAERIKTSLSRRSVWCGFMRGGLWQGVVMVVVWYVLWLLLGVTLLTLLLPSPGEDLIRPVAALCVLAAMGMALVTNSLWEWLFPNIQIVASGKDTRSYWRGVGGALLLSLLANGVWFGLQLAGK